MYWTESSGMSMLLKVFLKAAVMCFLSLDYFYASLSIHNNHLQNTLDQIMAGSQNLTEQIFSQVGRGKHPRAIEKQITVWKHMWVFLSKFLKHWSFKHYCLSFMPFYNVLLKAALSLRLRLHTPLLNTFSFTSKIRFLQNVQHICKT